MPNYLWPKMPPLLLCSAITTWSMAARRSFVFSRWAGMKKSKISEEKCKSQKGGLFINAFDAYHSLVLPRVEGWANFGKAGPRINHDKNISFLAITPSSPLLYITSPPTLLLPTVLPLFAKRNGPLCVGIISFGLKTIEAISRKINLPRILRDILDISAGYICQKGNVLWDVFGLVHIWNILSWEFTFWISWPSRVWTSRPAKNAKIRIVLCSSLWAMELEKAISHWQAHLLLSSPFFPQIYFLYRDPVTISFALKMPLVGMGWDEVSAVLGKLGSCKSGPGKLGPWKMLAWWPRPRWLWPW